jgi:hypothetical protein
MKRAVIEYDIANLKDNYFLFSMYIDSEKQEYIGELLDNVEVINNFLNTLLNQKINNSIASLYLEYINALDKYNRASSMLAKVKDDPVSA